jgi:hypothetical protein
VLRSSANPSVVGQAVTYTAMVTVVSPGVGTPTGPVEFFDGTAAVGSCTAQSLSATSVDIAICKVTYGATGSHTITAKYLGSGVFAASPVSGAIMESVGKASTTTAVITSVNPSTVGKSVTLTAGVAVASPGSGIPTGHVEFLDGTTPIAACGGAAGETLGGTGVASCADTFSTAGAHNIVAQYLGSGSFLVSTSPVWSQIVTRTSCATLSGCNLSGLNLAGANLSGANLSGTNLSGANLSGADLAGANLQGANLAGADLQAVNAVGANLAGDNMAGDNAAGADFEGADLVGSNASGADFAGDNLEAANLTNANFSGANLSGANLTGATTKGTNFSGANVKGEIH